MYKQSTFTVDKVQIVGCFSVQTIYSQWIQFRLLVVLVFKPSALSVDTVKTVGCLVYKPSNLTVDTVQIVGCLVFKPSTLTVNTVEIVGCFSVQTIYSQWIKFKL